MPNDNLQHDVEAAAMVSTSPQPAQPAAAEATAITTEEEGITTIAIADAVVLDNSSALTPAHNDDEQDVPVVQAVEEPTSSENDNDKVDTIRLDSFHIVSIRDMDPSQRPPEFASVILVNRPSYGNVQNDKGILGLTLQALGEERRLLVRDMDASSPLVGTAMKPGHVLVSINQTTCKGMTPDNAAATLLSSILTQSTTTIRLHWVGGSSSRVATTVEKTEPTSKIGMGFRSNARGSAIIASISPTGAMANSLLNPLDRVLSINGHDCTNVISDTAQLVEWIEESPRFVTIVTETTMSTGVVITTGEVSYCRSNTRHRNTASAANNNAESQGQQRMRAICICIVMIVFITGVSMVVTKVANEEDDDDFWDYNPPSPSYPYYSSPTPQPTPYTYFNTDECWRASYVPTDGTVIQGSNVYAPLQSNGDCAPDEDHLVDEGPGTWYTFYASETELMEVRTCVQDDFPAVATIYFGDSCQSLGCAYIYSDPFSSELNGTSHHFWAYSGSTYHILIQGKFGQTGDFDLKVQPKIDYTPSQCALPSDP